MIDTTIVREIARRIKRRFERLPREYCLHCGQNPGHEIDDALRVMEAVATHADSVSHPEYYGGIYVKREAIVSESDATLK